MKELPYMRPLLPQEQELPVCKTCMFQTSWELASNSRHKGLNICVFHQETVS